jgi:hypothetical protein
MYYFIHPIDDSTRFLEQIYIRVAEEVGDANVHVFAFDEDHKYLKEIGELPKNSNVIFLGHGRHDRFYGVLAESDEPYISATQMSIFEGQNLLAIACKSSELLMNACKTTNISNAIGFGHLPTSNDEVNNNRNMRKRIITEHNLNDFREVIVDVASKSLITCLNEGTDFSKLYFLFRLYLNRAIKIAIMDHGNSGVADLIFQMLSQVNYYHNPLRAP